MSTNTKDKTDRPFLSDIQELRRRAREHMEMGAVTSAYKADREKVKLASRSLFDALSKLLAQRERWTEKEQTQAEVEVFVLDHVFSTLPSPPFTDEEKQTVARQVYQHVWQQCASGCFARESSVA